MVLLLKQRDLFSCLPRNVFRCQPPGSRGAGPAAGDGLWLCRERRQAAGVCRHGGCGGRGTLGYWRAVNKRRRAQCARPDIYGRVGQPQMGR